MNILKLFSRNKTVQEDQQQLFFALEKIVNIALLKTERNENQSVKEIIQNLEQIFRKFWQLKKNNPKKFDSLLWSKDFYDKYVVPLDRPKDLVSDDSQSTKNAEEIKREGLQLLSFSAEEQLKGLTLFLNSFEKIWERAFHSNNDEISKYVVLLLNHLLSELTKEPLNNLFVEQFLRLLNSITWEAIRNTKSEKEINASVYFASIHWYIDIVFNRFGQRDRSFDLSYLDLFDKYFFTSVRYIVSENQTSLFYKLVSSLVDSIHIPSYDKGKIYDYGHLIFRTDYERYNKLDEKHEIEKLIKELYQSENGLETKEKLIKWLEKFENIKKILEPNFNAQQRKES